MENKIDLLHISMIAWWNEPGCPLEPPSTPAPRTAKAELSMCWVQLHPQNEFGSGHLLHICRSGSSASTHHTSSVKWGSRLRGLRPLGNVYLAFFSFSLIKILFVVYVWNW